MKPETYPAEPINPEDLVSKAIVSPVPKKLWEGDWCIDLTGDIEFLSRHFQSDIGDYLWIGETHRFFIKDERVWVEFKDGDKKQTQFYPDEVPFVDRWLPPIGMPRLATRFILKVREIDVRWTTEKRTDLAWIVGIERMANVDSLLFDIGK